MKVRLTHHVELTRAALISILNIGASNHGEEGSGKPAPIPDDAKLQAVSATSGANFVIVGDSYLSVEWESEVDDPDALPVIARPRKLFGPHSGT